MPIRNLDVEVENPRNKPEPKPTRIKPSKLDEKDITANILDLFDREENDLVLCPLCLSETFLSDFEGERETICAHCGFEGEKRDFIPLP